MRAPFLAVLLLSALPARADDAARAPQGPPAEVQEEKDAPQLVQLERVLTQKLEAKQNGQVTPAAFKEFARNFRATLDKTWAELPKSPANIGLHARIVAKLDDPSQALASLDAALVQNPDSPILYKARGHVQFQQHDYPAALASANWVLKYNQDHGQPADPEALSLKYSTEGRVAGMGTPTAQPLTARTQAPQTAAGQSDGRPAVLAAKADRAAPSEIPTPVSAPSGEPAPKQGRSPLLPILLLTGTALTVYGGYQIVKSKSTQTATEGLNPASEVSPEQTRRNYINSAVLIGTPVVIAGLVYGGPALWGPIAPAARTLWQHGEASLERVAASESGAVNLARARDLRAAPTLNNLNVQLAAQEIAGGHAYAKHAADLGVKNPAELAARIESIMANPTMVRALSNGRTAYWHKASATVVIRDPSALDGGTAFVPKNGVNYFLNLR